MSEQSTKPDAGNIIDALPGDSTNERPAGLKPVSEIKEDFYKRLYYKSEYDGILTGFNEIDRRLHGLKGVITLAGTPKTGKTTFALQLAAGAHNIKEFQGEPVNDRTYILFYSLELSQDAINEKLVTYFAAAGSPGVVTGNEIRFKGRGVLEKTGGVEGDPDHERFSFTDDKIKAIEAGERARLNLDRFYLRTIEDKPPGFIDLENDIKHIAERAKNETRETGQTPRILVIIDHLQLFRLSPDEIKNHEIKSTIDTENYLIEKFNTLQKNHSNLAIMLISQFNKAAFSEAGAGGDSQLEGVKGSVNITYVSSTIITMRTAHNFIGIKDEKPIYARLIGLNATDRFSAGIENMMLLFNPQAQTFFPAGTGVINKYKDYSFDFTGNTEFEKDLTRLAPGGSENPGPFQKKYGVYHTNILNAVNEVVNPQKFQNRKGQSDAKTQKS